MNDLKLNTESRDLVINKDGDLELLNSEAEVVRQTLEINLLTYRGEWFLDLSYGVPYFQSILSKPSSKNITDSILRQKILESYNVESIQTFESTLKGGVYTLDNLVVRTTDGDIASITNQILN